MLVGFIGLGLMGAGMASNLQKAGFKLVVHDLSRQAASVHLNNGAVWAASPREVAEQCDVIFTSLPAPPDVDAVALGKDGLIEGIKPGAAFFDLSTNAVAGVRALAEHFTAKGAHMLDAPVSGGPAGANSGKLAIWVGGDKAAFDKFKPMLDAMGDQARYIGPIGAGSVAKLVHNCTSAVMNAALAEVFTLGIKAGVEPLALWQAVRQGATGRKRSFDRLAEKFLPGIYDPPTFALRLLHKDVSLGTQLGRELGVPMRIVNLVQQEMTEALARGWANRDSNSYMLLQTERAGVESPKIDLGKIKGVLERDG